MFQKFAGYLEPNQENHTISKRHRFESEGHFRENVTRLGTGALYITVRDRSQKHFEHRTGNGILDSTETRTKY